MKLVECKPEGRIIFVGDTHGDFQASKFIVDKYCKPNNKIVFLGDYVDRGNYSKANIDFLLEKRQEHPRKIHLLQGNHEGYCIKQFYGADFWIEAGKSGEKEKYAKIFAELPLVFSSGSIIAVHGALPCVLKIEEVNRIQNGDKNWDDCVWADLEENGIPFDYFRQCYGKIHFDFIMSRMNKKVLIRGHNPYAQESLFDNRCLTLFTSDVYDRRKTIAIADFNEHRDISSIDDLMVVEI